MAYIDSIDMFRRFARGEFVRNKEAIDAVAVWLQPEDMDIGGGRMKLHEIDKLKDYPNAEVLTISGLNQEGFEYLIRTYGQQFKILQFFKNKLVEDWSLLSTLPNLEYLYYFLNQRIDRLWDMQENKNLKGVSILDFSKLKCLEGIEKAESLEYFCMGNAVWDKSEVDSYRYFANTNVRYLSFTGKKILDKDITYLVSMKKLEAFLGVMHGFTKEKFAWVKANAVNELEIGPEVRTWVDLQQEARTEVIFPWRGQRCYSLKNNEKRFARDVEQFEALVEKYRGLSYEAAFGKESE